MSHKTAKMHTLQIKGTIASCCPSHSTSTKARTREERKAARPKKRATLQEQFIKTNFDIVLLGIFFALYNASEHGAFAAGDDPVGAVANNTTESSTADTNPAHDIAPYSILFPWFVQIISVVIYYIVTRYFQSLPYTALVFILGTIIGYFTTGNDGDAISTSAAIWLNINGQLILLVFLPGLIFLDSYTINVHLFFQAFWQLINFAFPMVLGGAALTALFAKYVISLDWSFSLCMTFGAILSGTDPVAVSGLLNALGAPPRLSMHVAGESLLNDGSTVVLYQIFTSLYYYEFGIPNFGSDIGFGQGVGMFFQLALGGVAIGVAFGFVTVFFIYFLNRRLSEEENVIQVVTTICSAYLTYFVAEILCNSSGIIATLTCGLAIKILGEKMINDSDLTLHFWQVTGQLLTTLLFALGGLLWGNVISSNVFSQFATEDIASFRVQDWGWLILLYIYLIAVRYFLVFLFYPITKRTGLGTNIKEAVFMSYAGFRGAVGIALSLSLWANVIGVTESDAPKYASYRDDVGLLFGFVGGISLLTLLINGITSGPLLFYLGLATPKKTCEKVVENYRQQMINSALVSYVRLLSQSRFRDLHFSSVREHVPFLRDITFDQLMKAVEHHKSNTPSYLYEPPNIENVAAYLDGSATEASAVQDTDHDMAKSSTTHAAMSTIDRSICFPVHDENVQSDEKLLEERLNFIETLRFAYHKQIEEGELEAHGDVPYSLFQSLDFAENAATEGFPLNDWTGTQVASDTWVSYADKAFQTILRRMRQIEKWCKGCNYFDPEFFSVYLKVRQGLALVRAHRVAQRIFEEQFTGIVLTSTEEMVIAESNEQIKLVKSALKDLDQLDVDSITYHFACHILLNQSVKFVERLSRKGLIPEKEASEMLEDLDEYIGSLLDCQKLACRKTRRSTLFGGTGIQVGDGDLTSPLLERI